MTIKSNIVAEYTVASGVMVDGVLLKDGQLRGHAPILANNILEYSSGLGVTVDGVLIKDSGVTAYGGLVVPNLKPAVDSNGALQLQTAAGTPIIILDTLLKSTKICGGVQAAPLGAELLTNGTFATNDFTGWTAGANWSAATGAAVHTAGSTETLTQNVAVTSGTVYEIVFTMTGRSAGNVTISLGAVTLDIGNGVTAVGANANYDRTLMAEATGTLAFTITPDANFNGTLDSISLKAITATTNSILTLVDANWATTLEMRGSGALLNTALGTNALWKNTSGVHNTAIGYAALRSNTTGVNNTAIGVAALESNTVGNNNTAIGYAALTVNTTGASNTAIGYTALTVNTTGANNTAIGYTALKVNTTGANNTAIGYAALTANTTAANNTAIGYAALTANTTGAGNTAVGYIALPSNTTGIYNTVLGTLAARWHADGTTALTDPDYSVYIGYNARGYSNADNNSIVIGANAIGQGANTTVLGNTSTVLTALPGGALRLSEMSAPTGTTDTATLYTRDNGAGKTLLCCKLGDNVEIVLATQA